MNLENILTTLKQIRLQNSVIGHTINNQSNEKSDKYDYYYLIPEYLWENTLININLFVLNQTNTANKNSNAKEHSSVDALWYETRLPKLQIARTLAIKERRDLFFKENKNPKENSTEGKNPKEGENSNSIKDENLIITGIKEWLFTKVDWKTTYEKLKNWIIITLKEYEELLDELLKLDSKEEIEKSLAEKANKLNSLTQDINAFVESKSALIVTNEEKNELCGLMNNIISKSDELIEKIKDQNKNKDAILKIKKEFKKIQPELCVENFNTNIVQTFNRLIKKKMLQEGINIKTGFVLGDYDFIIELDEASTRKDINWPPAVYSNNKELITNYSYREYIVEKIELGKEDQSDAKKDEKEDQSDAKKDEKKPYILQFIKFKTKNDDNLDKKRLKKLISNLLNKDFEVYLSNSWNIIFVKIPITKFHNGEDKKLSKKYFESEFSTMFDNISQDSDYIEDIQSYIVLPCADDLNCECIKDIDINILNMKSIVKTSGAIESKTEYTETKIKNVIQSIEVDNLIKTTESYFTLGIIDYIINWGEIKLCNAIKTAILLINRLTSLEYKHISTLTSISVLDSNEDSDNTKQKDSNN